MSAPVVAGAVAIILAIVKFIVGITSGSLAVLSSAIDSMLDCLVSALNYFALKKSNANPNDKFNFGYGKVEALVALFEGAFIIGIAIFICYSSIQKLLNGTKSVETTSAMLVMVISMVFTGLLVLYLRRVYKKTGNLIIKADALHYKTDLLTNLAIFIALFVIWITGYDAVDAIFGIVVSIYIAFSAFGLVKDGVYILLDGALPSDVVCAIIDILNSKEDVKSYHYLKTRKSGEKSFFSVHLVFDPNISLSKAHKVADDIESDIKSKFNTQKWVFDTHFDIEDDRDKEEI
ncbi:cation diffusion facilitator family transporter [Campylobacter hyointestinalis]|uniref:cation diffusion facilitator family transporter n=1 Tax=Campylobacter hyointestinalis TaxID=198 RepID=UPI0007C8DFFB|nr:cation diffusion facilitator family transporter [Campylobacter hyointestinalis]ANE34620.1 cation diffusion facilitator family transporter [Campylobacter hyointestinalis subsp. lawsonii CCUG 27631]RAZ23998.1 cation transporter [Campylobacter hyointestinalis subsp. lawsonii]RAZ38416.1 cation transporter [Campylobacter hyointestinalis subsp. lawsonii]RAZ57223.1 cation transporter [Campylobacter hyointestinalis subsp. lawsonii]RAZ65379.1 cation transporter [Campylobacter hyointestinalis subsp. 